MEAMCNPKGGRTVAPASILTMLIMIMMLLNTYCCGASILAKSNTSFRCSDSRLDECLIEEDLELELGFLINPYVSRMLGQVGQKSPNSKIPEQPAYTKPCGKSNDPQYSECIHGKNPGHSAHTSTYSR